MKTYFQISAALVLVFILNSCSRNGQNDMSSDKLPVIFPDYTNIHIPCNIAPLNFMINEDADKYVVRIHSEKSPVITIKSKKGEIRIPENKWKKLLDKNKGKELIIDISVRQKNKKWEKFKSITNYISESPADPYIVYRKINPAYVYWNDMSIVQRDIENFNTSDIINNKLTEKNCMNCHSFQANNPDKMVLHVRKDPSGTVVINNGHLKVLNTKTNYTLSPFVYPAWHPTKNYIAFTTNQIKQVFNGHGHDQHHVYDLASDIVVYDIDNNSVFTAPQIATMSYENMPSWSPDGKYMYFISFKNPGLPPYDTSVKYDLLGISFNPETKEFGKVDTLLKASETGKSISLPLASPDGRYLLFSMADCGYFVVGNSSADIYIMDLKTKEYKKPAINSDLTDSYHSWSKNGRWLMFTSKRNDGLISLPYFSYFTKDGNFTKPFVLPQREPEFYKTYYWNFNRPEFVTGPVKFPEEKIVKALYSPDRTNVYFDTVLVDVDAIAGATEIVPKDTTVGEEYMKN